MRDMKISSSSDDKRISALVNFTDKLIKMLDSHHKKKSSWGLRNDKCIEVLEIMVSFMRERI